MLLVWFSLRGIPAAEGENKWTYLKNAWDASDKIWLLLMALVALVSHVLRAIRWTMLMKPAGYSTKLSYSFYSLMVGYLVNLVIPRGGEVSRCYNLYKLDKTPIDMSFGTVVVERVVDLVCLLILVFIAFLLESRKLFGFIETLPVSDSPSQIGGILLLVAVIGLLVIAVIVYLLKRNKKFQNFFWKTWGGFKQGLLSVFKLERKGLFITYSVLIWLLYFVMSYTVMKAFPSTQAFGLDAVLSLFAIGSIAMAVPLPGGAGSYHVLVPQGLVMLYAIPRAEAVAFVFIFHGWQTLIMITGGALSLMATSYVVRKRSTAKPDTDN